MPMPDPDITLDVDLRNPGQFFACCGLLELASRLWPGSEGWFAAKGPRARFHIATSSGANDPLDEIVRKLCEAEPLVTLADDHEEQAQADRKPVVIAPFQFRLDWWLDTYRDGEKSELKVWAGQQTPERNINSLREAWRSIRSRNSNQPAETLFRRRWPLKGRFGFDPAASWEALDVGFSPDEQDLPVQTSPATEIFAAIGLQRCRPVLDRQKRGRWFTYHSWSRPLEIAIAPAAVAGIGGSGAVFEFPVKMRNAQYGSFGWAKPVEEQK